MRLLPKSEIDKAKAAQQQRDVDEGLKLARRIDNLREVLAQEDANLQKFRRETVAKIGAEIAKLEQKKSTLTGEISHLNRERRQLMKPLDEEWGKIHKANAQIDKRRGELSSWEIIVSNRERDTKAAVKQAGEALAKAAIRDERTAELLEDADKASKKADSALKNAKEVEAKALALKEAVEKEFAERDMNMAARERGLDMREANIATSEAELAKEWELLEDRKKMFDRQIKRSQK